MGTSIYGHPLKADFVVMTSIPSLPNGFVIECKWQASDGSVDEKFPYIIENINGGCFGRPVLIVVDYLGLMSPTTRHENRVQDVSEVSRGLKLLAKELRVPVLACAQLNRGVEQRQEKRPKLSDLRDSGAIEQDADQVWFLTREDGGTMRADRATVFVAKNRTGPTCDVDFVWEGKSMRFTEAA